jgi:uncharacterized protein YdhG (YjbR/CyaY superfamily)
MMSSSAQVKAYLAALPPDARSHLNVIRGIVRDVAPQATESWSFSNPRLRR